MTRVARWPRPDAEARWRGATGYGATGAKGLPTRGIESNHRGRGAKARERERTFFSARSRRSYTYWQRSLWPCPFPRYQRPCHPALDSFLPLKSSFTINSSSFAAIRASIHMRLPWIYYIFVRIYLLGFSLFQGIVHGNVELQVQK